jgi:hypothetical protein
MPHPNPIAQWKDKPQSGAPSVRYNLSSPSEQPIDVKARQSEVHELTWENDFLDDAFTKASFAYCISLGSEYYSLRPHASSRIGTHAADRCVVAGASDHRQPDLVRPA